MAQFSTGSGKSTAVMLCFAGNKLFPDRERCWHFYRSNLCKFVASSCSLYGLCSTVCLVRASAWSPISPLAYSVANKIFRAGFIASACSATSNPVMPLGMTILERTRSIPSFNRSNSIASGPFLPPGPYSPIALGGSRSAAEQADHPLPPISFRCRVFGGGDNTGCTMAFSTWSVEEGR